MYAARILWITANSPPPVPAAEVSRTGWNIHYRPPEGVAEALGRSPYEAIVLEFPLGGWSAAGLLEAARRLAPGVPVLIRAAPADAPEVMHLTGRGAAQFLADGAQGWVQLGCVLEGIRKGGLARLAERAQREDWEGLLVGESPELRQVMHIVRLVASRRCTVLITGETGTGKEMVARCLHLAGTRRRGPLVAVDCSALPENLLETELFGHVRGAFTGAVQNRTGRFEQAHGGTLFLDEIGELPPPVQVKLLRVLQEREFQRLGSSETVRTDVRVIAATNCDLPRAIERGLFREDLYYRLNVVPIQMPSLRQRPDDVPILAMHFVEKICHNEQIEPKSLAPEALARLRGHAWPGNVRQLENAVEMAVALSGERRILTALDFPLPEAPARSAAPGEFPLVALPDQGLNYERTLAAVERSILEQALRKTGGNKKAAAEMLGLKRTTLAAKVRTLAVEALC